MKNRTIIRSAVGAAAVAFASCAHSAPQTDFNEVSKQAAIMLQNRHYYKEDFDEAMSQRIYDLFMKTIDGGKIYLTATDAEEFEKKYKNTLTDIILAGKSVDAAEEMFDRVKMRAKTRHAEVVEYLNNTEFKFNSDRELISDRSKVGWPQDEAAAQQLWKDMAEDLMLTEELRRSNIIRLAMEQGKPNPLKDERSAKETVLLKFKRDSASIEKTDREEIANYMISALGAAYCPHTDYFSAREMEAFRSSIRTQLTGIGAMLQTEDDGAIKVTGIIINGPSDKQGDLKLNDRIIGVEHLNDGNMTDIMFMKLDKVVELIKGPKGTEVKLKVQPASDPTEIKFIVIKRDRVQLKGDQAKAQIFDVNLDGRKQKLGVIKLPSFYANFETGVPRCSVDVEKLIVRLNKENVQGLLLDLRGNGGGSLEEVRRMTGFFTGYGPVVQVRNTRNQISAQRSDRKKAIYNGPLVVAIDKSSASASEILAGALQDYNRAVIVGDSSTFGKGTVQQPFNLKPWLPAMSGRERAGFLKPTIQKFYRVAGSSTQLKGVEADIVLPSIYDGLEIGEKHMDYALKHDVIKPASGFKPMDRAQLHIAKLKEASTHRVNKSQDYQYIREDLDRILKRIEENKSSLNKEKRQTEIDMADRRTKTRNKERIERFKKLQQEDIKNFSVYRLELDDLKKDDLVKLDLTDIQDTHMRRAKSDLDDLNQTPEWPSQIDVTEREALNILMDLVDLSQGVGIAKVKVAK